jgi:hypothetical protein
MQYLQRLDSLVEQDVQQQMAELKRKEGLLGRRISIEGQLVSMARDKGLDDRAAIASAASIMKDDIANRLLETANNSGSEMAKANAMKLASEVSTLSNANKEELRQHAENARNKAQLDAANEKHKQVSEQQDWAKIAIARKAAEAKASGGGKPLNGPITKTLAGYMRSVNEITQMRELAQNSGIGDRMYNVASSASPVDLGDEGARRNAKVKQFEALKYGWMTGTAKGALQKHELEALEPLLGGPSSLKDPTQNLKEAQKVAIQQARAQLTDYARSGYDVSGMSDELDKIEAGSNKVDFTPKGK